MSSKNKINILGNVGEEPKITELEGGKICANLSVATSETWKNKNNEKVIETEWHKVTFYDPVASIIKKYVSKGDKIDVEGKIKSRRFTNKEGQEVTYQYILGKEIVMLGSPYKKTNNNDSHPNTSNSTPQTSSDNFDDLPF